MNAHEINDLVEQESPVGQLYMRLKELGIAVEREWWIDEQGIAYIVDLALPYENGWLPVSFGDRPGPAGGLRFAAEEGPDACLWDVPSSEAKRDCPPGQAGVANARRQAPAPNPTIKTNHPRKTPLVKNRCCWGRLQAVVGRLCYVIFSFTHHPGFQIRANGRSQVRVRGQGWLYRV
jgi:hypothetical protein